jgi:hypothetical protein
MAIWVRDLLDNTLIIKYLKLRPFYAILARARQPSAMLAPGHTVAHEH